MHVTGLQGIRTTSLCYRFPLLQGQSAAPARNRPLRQYKARPRHHTVSCYSGAAEACAMLLPCKWPSLAQACIEDIGCIMVLTYPFIDVMACLYGQGKNGVQER